MPILLLDTFQSPIRITRCGHVYCEKCLQDVRNGVQTRRWRCPHCRKQHNCSVNSLTRNYHLEKLVEKFKKEKPTLEPRNLFGTCKKHDRAIEYRE